MANRWKLKIAKLDKWIAFYFAVRKRAAAKEENILATYLNGVADGLALAKSVLIDESAM